MIKVKGTIAAVLLIMSLALALRLYALDKYPFWHDEAAAALEDRSVFSLPPVSAFRDEQVSLERRDYLFLYNHGFVYSWKKLFGNSVFGLRLSSVFFSLAAMLVFYKLALALYGSRAAILALLLLAVSAFNLYFSQELKPYPALMLLGLSSFYYLFNIFKRDRKRDWAFYALFNIAAIYCHYMMLLVLLFEFFALSAYCLLRKKPLRPLVFAHVAIAFGVFPVITILLPNLRFIITHQVALDLTDFPVWGQRIGLMNIAYTLKNFAAGYYTDFYSPAGVFLTAILSALFFKGVFFSDNRGKRYVLAFLLWAPIISLFVISIALKPCYVDRYFIPVFPLFLIAAAAGLSGMKKPAAAAVLFIILMFSVSALNGYYSARLPQDNAQHIGVLPRDAQPDSAARYIRCGFKEGDMIFSAFRLFVFPLKFYIDKELANIGDPSLKKAIEEEAQKGRVLWLEGKGKLMSIEKRHIWQSRDRPVPFILEQGRRIWLLHSLFDPRPGIMEELSVNYEMTDKAVFRGLEVFLFTPKRGTR